MRLEDVPSASAIDSAAAKTQANLLIPPGMEEVPAVEPVATETSASSDPEAVDPPSGLRAVWRVRYRENGFDAENADGDTCAGWALYGESGPHTGQSVKMACSDGRTASLLIGAGQSQIYSGTVMFGQVRESATIENN